jgi:hypothetical protein
VWFFKRNKAVSFFIFFYWIAYGPTSNFLITSSSILAERFLYLPLLAFAALCVLGAESLMHKIGTTLELDASSFKRPWPRLVPHGAIVVILILYGSRSYASNTDWRSDITPRGGDGSVSAQFSQLCQARRAYYQPIPTPNWITLSSSPQRVAIIDPLPTVRMAAPLI